MKRMVLAMVAGALVLAACGGGGSTNTPTVGSGSTAATSRSTTAACAATPISTPVLGGNVTKKYACAPAMTIDTNKKYFATIKMDIGDIKLELFAKDAPVTVNNFVFLSRDHYYDGVTFHRVIPNFVAQAGDPTGTGSGGPGYTIKDEVNSHQFLDGTLGMAKTSAPNSGGSQWFIDYTPQTSLNGGYTAFGQVVSGRDVLDKIMPRDPASATQPGTKINTIEIEEQ